jgi:hypothetical protein
MPTAEDPAYYVRADAIVPREGYRLNPRQRWFGCRDLYLRVERGAMLNRELGTPLEQPFYRRRSA